MKPSTLIQSVFVALPALVSAVGTLGFALGTKKPDGSCKYQADYEADYDAIRAASGSSIIRGYSASDCNFAEYALPAAKTRGFQVILGIWPDVPESLNADTAAIQQYLPGNEGQVYAITVGSETLYRGNFTGAELLNIINGVKAKFPNFPSAKVGTADSWNKYADGTADPLILGGVQLFLVNAFGFWQGQDISNATHQYFDDTMQAFQHIEDRASQINSNPELWTGETGWPSDGGTNYGAAIAGTANANTYYHSAICGMLSWGVNVFDFEAFDEPWKPVSIGDNGNIADETHWGAMTASRQAKYSLRC